METCNLILNICIFYYIILAQFIFNFLYLSIYLFKKFTHILFIFLRKIKAKLYKLVIFIILFFFNLIYLSNKILLCGNHNHYLLYNQIK